jgi:hypothetical protein
VEGRARGSMWLRGWLGEKVGRARRTEMKGKCRLDCLFVGTGSGVPVREGRTYERLNGPCGRLIHEFTPKERRTSKLMVSVRGEL